MTNYVVFYLCFNGNGAESNISNETKTNLAIS